MKESDIIQLCKQRDPVGQKALVYQYSEVLMAIAYRYTLSQEDSKDALQDTFIQVFQKIDLYDPQKGALLPWLKSVTVRMVLMQIRKRKKIFENRENYQTHQSRNLNYKMIDADLEAQDLYQLVLGLPDIQRIVFSMYAIEGFNHKEIAAKLELTESYSRTILTRARKSLQALLAEKKIRKVG